MILNVNILRNNKVLGKGREQAADLLASVVKTFGLSQPNYTYKEKQDDSIVPTQEPPVALSPRRLKDKKKKKVVNKEPKTFICEVSAPIPAAIYDLKLIRERGQQRKQLLKDKQSFAQKENHALNGTASNASNVGMNGIQQLLPINGSTSMKSALIKTTNGEHVEVPITFPEPTKSKKGVNIFGAGECDTKSAARNLAALEVIYQMEQILNVPRGELQSHMNLHAEKLLQITDRELHHNFPYHEEIPGVSWQNIPTDASFATSLIKKTPPRHFAPATRQGYIDFIPPIVNNEHALIAAKAITLSSKDFVPTVDVHANTMKEGSIQRFANIQPSGGPLEGVIGTLPGGELNIGLDSTDATVVAFIHLFNKMTHGPTQKNFTQVVKERYLAMAKAIFKEKDTSYGMAKLYVSLPKHQFQDLRQLIDTIPIYKLPNSYTNAIRRRPPYRRLLRHHSNGSSINRTMDRERQERIETFRQHQKLHPLPVDSIEKDIPHNVSVTIVRGGTGSGKTTRYPLMLNLFSPEPSHIVVAQPRRLACQTAARRVAQEQGYTLGKSSSCPIGYSVRFESIQPSYTCDRTIQFQTPGVLLRRASEDPLLSEMTHLCIDEIHERNADIDLLLALAKQAVQRRLNHKELPPLKLILMSATLDSSHWESYFRGNDKNDKRSQNVSVAVVNVPEIRRYPITTVHLDDGDFPLERYHTQELIHKRGQYDEDSEDDICRVTALLALRLYQKSMEGSILCFLPGMEEIRRVHRYIEYRYKGQILPKVIYLHSSVNSKDQALAFEPGAKIILSTNIAETSVTIPDCKFVIDSGRERQFSLLGSSSSPTADESEASSSISVVGSQLVSVDISVASAKQRAGRAGRVSAGTCYRLYTRNMFQYELPEFTTPEMLRMDLSQLVLHSISLHHPSSGNHPLSLLSGAPDPPAESKLRQTLRGLVSQGLVDIGDDQNGLGSLTPINEGVTTMDDASKDHSIRLTPLGRAVNEFPVEPRVGRMLFLGLALRAIDPSLTIAALLSVPKVFSPSTAGKDETKGITTCSDIIVQMEAYNKYINGYIRDHPKAIVFDQVSRIRGQLERAMKGYLGRSMRNMQTDEVEGTSEINWNMNSDRVAAQAALICSATPHIAHLVHAKEEFATRDVAGTAKIHPTSVNHRPSRRAYWYVYHELRQGKAPYLYTTTAVSPLELALFSDADSISRSGPKEQHGGLYEHIQKVFGDNSWMLHADHWVPVVASIPTQKEAIMRLRQMLMYDMLQQVALDPISFAKNEKYMEVILYVLSALEQQRLPPPSERNKYL